MIQRYNRTVSIRYDTVKLMDNQLSPPQINEKETKIKPINARSEVYEVSPVRYSIRQNARESLFRANLQGGPESKPPRFLS